MTTITTFTKPALRALRPELDAALAALGERFGITLRAGNIRFDNISAKITVEAAVRNPDGSVVSPAAKDFKLLAFSYGLEPTDLGRSFTLSGNQFTLTGCRHRATAKPLVITRADGKVFHAGVELVKALLKAQVAA